MDLSSLIIQYFMKSFFTLLLLIVLSSGMVAAQSPLLGPSLNAPTPTSVNVWWHLADEAPLHVVEYGLTNALGSKAELRETSRFPNVALTGLENGKTYFYRVASGNTRSEIFSFRLPSVNEPLNIVLWSDNQSGYEIFRDKTVPAMQALNPDLLITPGDLVNTGGVYEEWDFQLYGPARALFRTVPWYGVRGNHDYNGDVELGRQMFPLPGNNHWYAVTYGDVRMVFLNTNRRDAEQMEFVQNEVVSEAWKSAKYRIVVCHHPPFTSLWDNPGYDGEAILRSLMVPVLENNGADLVISGHAHDYERLERNRADGRKTHYLIIGGAGGALDTIDVFPWPFSVIKHSRHHILQMEVNHERMVLRAIDTFDGTDLDLFQIRANN